MWTYHGAVEHPTKSQEGGWDLVDLAQGPGGNITDFELGISP